MSKEQAGNGPTNRDRDEQSWPLWEVFVQSGKGRGHEHVGSVHAPDGPLALQNARDVYARRDKVNSIWVVPSQAIVSNAGKDAESFFDPSFSTPYRHPQFYPLPKKS